LIRGFVIPRRAEGFPEMRTFTVCARVVFRRSVSSVFFPLQSQPLARLGSGRQGQSPPRRGSSIWRELRGARLRRIRERGAPRGGGRTGCGRRLTAGTEGRGNKVSLRFFRGKAPDKNRGFFISGQHGTGARRTSPKNYAGGTLVMPSA